MKETENEKRTRAVDEMTEKNMEKDVKKDITRASGDTVFVIVTVCILVAIFAALALTPVLFGFGAVPVTCGISLAALLGLFVVMFRP